MGYRALLIDMDGTLLDSAPRITDAVNAARAEVPLPPLRVDQVAPHVGWGLTRLLAGTLPPAHRGEAARSAFHAHLDGTTWTPVLFPGAETLIRECPVPVALVTNQPGRVLRPLLARLGWPLAAVVDGDHPSGRKPDPGPIMAALEALQVAAAHALFVGDSAADRDAAAAAGVDFRAVAWGHVADAPQVASLAEVLEAVR